MTTRLNGIVHGKTAELTADPHFAEGEQVEVAIRPRKLHSGTTTGEGIRRSAGAWAAYPEMDETMAEIQLSRKGTEGIRRSAGILADDQDADAHMQQVLQSRKMEPRRQVDE